MPDNFKGPSIVLTTYFMLNLRNNILRFGVANAI